MWTPFHLEQLKKGPILNLRFLTKCALFNFLCVKEIQDKNFSNLHNKVFPCFLQSAWRIFVEVLSYSKHTIFQMLLPVNFFHRCAEFILILWQQTVRKSVQVCSVEFPLLEAKVAGVQHAANELLLDGNQTEKYNLL